MVYPVILTPASREAPGETGFVVTCRDLPELIAQGETEVEALAAAADALEEAVAHRLLANLELPPASKMKRGERAVALSAPMAAKLALHRAVRAAGISKSELARRLGIDEKDARRLLDPHHGSKLSALAAAVAVTGKRLVIELEDAA